MDLRQTVTSPIRDLYFKFAVCKNDGKDGLTRWINDFCAGCPPWNVFGCTEHP